MCLVWWAQFCKPQIHIHTCIQKENSCYCNRDLHAAESKQPHIQSEQRVLTQLSEKGNPPFPAESGKRFTHNALPHVSWEQQVWGYVQNSSLRRNTCTAPGTTNVPRSVWWCQSKSLRMYFGAKSQGKDLGDRNAYSPVAKLGTQTYSLGWYFWRVNVFQCYHIVLCICAKSLPLWLVSFWPITYISLHTVNFLNSWRPFEILSHWIQLNNIV